MAIKKLILFIVEGESDKRSLEAILDNYFDPQKIAFDIIHGDITQDSCSSAIKGDLNEKIQYWSRTNPNKYKITDIKNIIQLVDMDGTYIPPCNIIKNTINDETIYLSDKIETINPDYLINKHNIKSSVLNVLSRLQEITITLENPCVKEKKPQRISLPYRVYYFSRNLEHVLYNDPSNLTDTEKKILSENFEAAYDGNVQRFLQLINPTSVSGTYEETWDFIKQGNNSLNRFNNVHLIFS